MKKLFYIGNELSVTHPQVASEWCYEKNGILTPDDITAGCNYKVYWKCQICGHIWKTSVNHRTSQKQSTSCPKCAELARAKTRSEGAAKLNNFGEKFPLLAQEWHERKNGDLLPDKVSVSSNKNVWWQCSVCGYEWKTSVNHRTNGRGCPNCSKSGTSIAEQVLFYAVKQFFEDAENRYKEMGMEFDIYIPSLNTAIEYDGVFYHCQEKRHNKDNEKDVFCKEHNIRLIRIRDPKLKDTVCAERITVIDNPEITINVVVEKVLSLLNVKDFKSLDAQKIRFIVLSEYKNRVREKSILKTHPELVKEWNDKKNYPLKVESISYGSDLMVWWKCKKCGFEWKSTTSHRVSGRGCPACAGKKVYKGYNDFETLYPDIAKEWHYDKNYPLKPDEITSGVSRNMWWRCAKCGYEWQAAPATRKKGVGCPFCAGKAVKVGVNDLKTTFPELAKEWHGEKNGDLTPERVSKGSAKKVWWKCSVCGYEWQANIYSRTSGTGCPDCFKNKKRK